MNQSKFFISFLFYISFTCFGFSQSSWEELSDLTFTGIERVFSFEIDGTVYVGGGRINDGVTVSTMWAYDINEDSWTFRSDFPGPNIRNAFAFQIDGTGYMGAGYTGAYSLPHFWKYEPINDDWIQLPDFPGGGRSHALALSADSKAYVLAGGVAASTLDGEAVYYNDLWEFDPVTESWTLLGNLPGETRWRAYGWLLDQKIYIGGGSNPEQSFEDLYAFDLTTGTWEEKKACATEKIVGGFYFTLHDKGYFVEGASLDETSLNLSEYGNRVFEYDPSSDTWSQEGNFIGPPRVFGFSVTYQDKVILGLGRNYEDDTLYKDVYSFTIDLTSTYDLHEDIDFSIYPNPAASVLNIQGVSENTKNVICNISDTKGSLVLSIEKEMSKQEQNIDISQLKEGIYQLEIIYNNTSMAKRFIKI